MYKTSIFLLNAQSFLILTTYITMVHVFKLKMNLIIMQITFPSDFTSYDTSIFFLLQNKNRRTKCICLSCFFVLLSVTKFVLFHRVNTVKDY